MNESGAMPWGRVTYEMMESYWPAVARGDEEAPPAMRERTGWIRSTSTSSSCTRGSPVTGPTLYQSGLPSTRRLELLSANPLRNGTVAMHYRRAR